MRLLIDITDHGSCTGRSDVEDAIFCKGHLELGMYVVRPDLTKEYGETVCFADLKYVTSMQLEIKIEHFVFPQDLHYLSISRSSYTAVDYTNINP